MKINYLNKSYLDYQKSLLNFISTYYKGAINNLSPSDPAKIFIDIASYVGDVISYYIDYQFKENLFYFAEDYTNVILLSQTFGYKPRIVSPAIVKLDIYQIVPSIYDNNTNSFVPDFNYALKIKRGLKATTNDNTISFRTIDDIDFSENTQKNSLEISVYDVDQYNNPTFFLLKKQVIAESVEYKTFEYQINEGKPYLEIEIPEDNVIGINNVIDSEGNKWYEVDFLSQGFIPEKIQNWDNNSKEQVPYILNYKYVTKKFITRYNENLRLKLIFGNGNILNKYDEELLPNVDNIGIFNNMRRNIDINEYPINTFLFSKTYGEMPHDTTLKIEYITAQGEKANVLANTITKIDEYEILNDTTNLDYDLLNLIKNSLSVNNPEVATGGMDRMPIEEIKQNAIFHFASQNRCVTSEDYTLRVKSMPSIYGNIAKVYVDKNENNEIDIYILSYNNEKKLIQSNYMLKENLSKYLDKYKMITDIINIKDAFIINIKVYFEISVLNGYNNKEILYRAIEKLKSYFDIDKWEINQPININDIQKELLNVEGINYVKNIKIENVFDEELGYSNVYYNIENATSGNIIYPPQDIAIFEVKYPDTDIFGRVV